MKASKHPQLGRVIALVIRANGEMLDDPMNDYAGFTPAPTPELEKIVRKEGFANLQHFRSVVSKRSSPRFAYFNLP